MTEPLTEKPSGLKQCSSCGTIYAKAWIGCPKCFDHRAAEPVEPPSSKTSNASSVVDWLLAANYAPEAMHRINIACDTIERLQGELAEYEGPRVAELLAENTQFMLERDRLQRDVAELRAGFGGEAYTELVHTERRLRAALEDIRDHKHSGHCDHICTNHMRFVAVKALGPADEEHSDAK